MAASFIKMQTHNNVDNLQTFATYGKYIKPSKIKLNPVKMQRAAKN